MKYYLYVSDVKVDMLYAQIPHSIRDKIATELKIDLKVISTTFKDKNIEETRYSKLQMVTDYVKNNLGVGTIDEPNSFFQGTLRMVWPQESDYFGMAYFAGETERTLLTLGGSSRHIVGYNSEETGKRIDGSSLRLIRAACEQVLKSDNTGEEFSDQSKTLVSRSTEHLLRSELSTQRFEFLAKRLDQYYYRARNRLAVIGTPIYVALAD